MAVRNPPDGRFVLVCSTVPVAHYAHDHPLITDYHSLLYEPSCLPNPPRPPLIRNLCRFSTLHWKPTSIKTKRDLSSHPLLPTLQPCDSAEAILTVLREHIPTFSQSENGDNGLTKWVAPTVNVLYSFSATLGGAVGLVSIRELVKDLCSNDYLLGVPSSKRNLYGHWRSPLGWYPSSLPCETCLTHLASRRLKKPALAMISLLNFLTASNISSVGLRFTLALHRLPL